MDRTVYTAPRVAIVIAVVVMLALCLGIYWLGWSGIIREVEFRRSLLRALEHLSPDNRVWLCYGLAAFLAIGAAAFSRFLFDPVVVVMDDDGIAIRYPFSAKAAEWEDYIGVERFMGFPKLKFTKSPHTVYLPAPAFGIDNGAIIADVMERIEQRTQTGPNTFAGRPASASSASLPDLEPIAPQPYIRRPRPTRVQRTFGRRSVTPT